MRFVPERLFKKKPKVDTNPTYPQYHPVGPVDSENLMSFRQEIIENLSLRRADGRLIDSSRLNEEDRAMWEKVKNEILISPMEFASYLARTEGDSSREAFATFIGKSLNK